jgi:DNA replication protein DnaD
MMKRGTIIPDNPDEVIPREPKASEFAQLRDLAEEISTAGGCSLDNINEAFQEAARQGKMKVRYARGILFNWMGIKKEG